MSCIRPWSLSIFGAIAILFLGPRPSPAQSPATTVQVAPSQTFVVPSQARAYRVPTRAIAPRRVRYRTPQTVFTRYQRVRRTGVDPNWAARRGVPLYKPWLY